jgi:hypothetical protein
MAKPLGGGTKLTERVKKSAKKTTSPAKPKKTKITGTRAAKKTTIRKTSYRLTDDDKARLKQLIEAVDELEPNKKISETYIIKAALNYCTKIKPEKLIKAGREIGA